MTSCVSMPKEYRHTVMRRRENIRELPAIAQWLFTARSRSGKSQEQIAAAADIDTTYVSKIELGQKNPSRKVVCRLAAALTPENADEHTSRLLLNSGLKAAGYVHEDDTILSTDPPDNFEDWPLELRQALAHTRTLPRVSQELVYKLWLEQARAHADIEERRQEAERKLIEREELLNQK